MSRKEENHPRQLLVEGPDDFAVVFHLGSQHPVINSALGSRFKIVEKGGKEALLSSIPLKIKTDALQCLGILVDADRDMLSSWESVRNRLIDSGYSDVPASPPLEGWVSNGNYADIPRIGVWIMPNNRDVGILEDFLIREIPSSDALLAEAITTLDSLEQRRMNLYSVNDRRKAEVHTWLAWQKEPGLQLGTSITAKILQPSSPTVVLFTKWLEKLFLEG